MTIKDFFSKQENEKYIYKILMLDLSKDEFNYLRENIDGFILEQDSDENILLKEKIQIFYLINLIHEINLVYEIEYLNFYLSNNRDFIRVTLANNNEYKISFLLINNLKIDVPKDISYFINKDYFLNFLKDKEINAFNIIQALNSYNIESKALKLKIKKSEDSGVFYFGDREVFIYNLEIQEFEKKSISYDQNDNIFFLT